MPTNYRPTDSVRLLLTTFLLLLSHSALAVPGLDSRPANGTCTAPQRLQTQGEIQLQPMLASVGDVSWPVDLVQPPNDPSKWYVIDREGTVVIYQDGNPFTPLGTFIDVRDRVQRNFNGKPQNEMGLLGMAFDPDFAVNGEFYLYYSADGSDPNGSGPLAARLSRFKSTDGGITASPNSEEIIFSYDKNKEFHWGGRPTFGSDGYLYIAIGEAGQPAQAQNLNSHWGKMLRIDVHKGTPYGIPPDNPYVGKNGLDEIYALGFRNPWRWSFDSLTGDIWLGDVGNSLWEEVNKVVKGGNYGWRVMEGFECSFFVPNCDPTGLTLPVTVYGHDANAGPVGNAIIGGFVYRGSLMPSMYGKYIYADVGGTIWAYDETTDQNELLLDSGNFILSISESTIDRELYLLANQAIYKFTEANSNTDQGDFPQKLSETGCFDSSNPKVPGSMLIPYDVNMALWSDNAAKNRWMLVPDGKKIQIEGDGDWTFPIGTVLFKEFKLNNTLVETRMLVRHDDGGWAGYSYEWNAAQTDATLLPPEGKSKAVGAQTWAYPSRSQCLGCHTSAAGRALGPETAQLNKSILYSSTGIVSNQLETLNQIGMFSQSLGTTPDKLPALPAINDTSAALEDRARAYLHANCAMCHRPNGTGQGPEDFRWYLPLSQIGAVNVVPTQGDLGIADARLLFPGRPDKSIMSFRMHTLDNNRMPPLGTAIVDQTGTQLIDSWISSMAADACGEPLVTPGAEKGIYAWKDCATGEWNLVATGGGDPAGVIFSGQITADTNISNVVGVELEPSDTLDNSTDPAAINLVFKLWNAGKDGARFTVPDNAGVCIDVTNEDTGSTLYIGAGKTPVAMPYSLQGSGCNPSGQTDNVNVLRALYYPSSDKIWVRAMSDLEPLSSAQLTVTATTNGVDQVLGDLVWRPADNAYQKTFLNLPVAPDCITVDSANGGTGQLAVEGTGNCDSGGNQNADTLTLVRAIYFAADKRIWIKAGSDAVPAGSSEITATLVTNGVQTNLGTIGWKADKNAYQQEFKNIPTAPSTLILNSQFGGTVTGSVEIQ